jgi:predicted nucleotide-binding protein (sugar kinase/HSP70/actin superfamily)
MFNSTEKIKIGIPRTLFYYSYYPFCYKFFTSLGAEVISSEKTNKTTIEEGLNVSSNELCIPLKVLYGHIQQLKDKVNYIFLPYMISSRKGEYYCPKIVGSPDIVKANIPNLKLISADVDVDNFYKSVVVALTEIATKLSANPLKIYNAYKDSMEYQKKFDKYIHQGVLFDEAIRLIEREDTKPNYTETKLNSEDKKTLNIAVIGHIYIINDDYISFSIIKKLKERNIRVSTSDKLTDSEIQNYIKVIGKTPHWSLGSRVLGAAIYYSKNKNIDGIIYVTPFGCSSDSLIKEYMDANANNKPILTLTVDEHTSDAGMITRLEAFLDMIERRKDNSKKNNKNIKETKTLNVNKVLTEISEE